MAEGDVDQKVRNRFFPQNKGVFVEIGAARPDFLSVSALFRGDGWKVIAIEPNPDYAYMHELKGHKILQYACGDRDEDNVPFKVFDSHGAKYAGGEVSFESFSSLELKSNYAKILPDGVNCREIKVKLRRLDTILAKYHPEVQKIDIVCVDVEGWELEVLVGLDFARYSPKVVITENMFFEDAYRDFMRARGYSLWRTIEFNEVYIRDDLCNWHDKFVSWVIRIARKAKAKLRFGT